MSRLKISKFAVSRFEIKKFAVCKGGGDIGLVNEFGTSTRRNHKMHSTSVSDINALMEHTHWNRHNYFTKYLVHEIYLQLYVLSTCKATDFLFYFLTVINFLCRKCTRAYHLKETTKMCCSTCILSNTIFQYCTWHCSSGRVHVMGAVRLRPVYAELHQSALLVFAGRQYATPRAGVRPRHRGTLSAYASKQTVLPPIHSDKFSGLYLMFGVFMTSITMFYY